jgi:hypothetical protein
MATIKTSIVDVPKRFNETDLFGIDKYSRGLIRFIQRSDTPITIAIQGEWGSGKTSLMNTLQNELCGVCETADDFKNHNKEFYSIWVNTWQYSLLRSQEETLISIVASISTEVARIVNTRHKSNLDKLSKSIFGITSKVVKGLAKTAAEQVAGDNMGEVVSDLLSNDQAQQTISELRNSLQDAINECLKKDQEKGNPQKGFIVFVDDLDRIDPPVAVQILELLKNIFDLENCIFVLAIDYDVVIKGLKPKFGELTDKNEREFRSFFDKIIQMPFSMPVASYTIDQFLISSLVKIGYVTEKKIQDHSFAQSLTAFCNFSVGSNPRSLKRLLNTVSLINIISKEGESFANEQEEDYILLLNFALICIQIAYPHLYKILCMESDFRSWNHVFATSLKLPELTEAEKAKLSESDEFDEEWEQILFRICERDNYLSNKSVQISQMMNLMFKVLPEGEDLGSTLNELLALSSVTDVQAFDKPKQAINKGPVLKTVSASIVPLLKSRLKVPYPTVRQQSKKVVSNVYISFSQENWKDCIGITIDNIKDKLSFWFWFHPWAFWIVSPSMEADIKNAGFENEMTSLKKRYLELETKYPGCKFKYPPMEKSATAKGWHVPLLTASVQFNSVDEIVDANNMAKMADIITDFMDCNSDLKNLFAAYNEKVKK